MTMPEGRSARALDRAGDRTAKAHHRLVDRANLLDIQGAIGQALAIEHQQAIEHAPDHAIGDAGNGKVFALP